MMPWKSVGLGAVALGVMISWSVSAQQRQAPIYMPQGGGGAGVEYFAPNLGIYYRLVPYGVGGGAYNPTTGNYDPSNPPGGVYQAPSPFPQAPMTYGARLSRYPVANSAAANLQFEPGDMIVTLDNMTISGPNDVLNHRFQTSMIFINVRTGQPQATQIYLP